MHILLTNYNYYPFAYGGSEVYVAALAEFLFQKGHTVCVMASVPTKAFEEHPVVYEDGYLKVCRYQYQHATVYGVKHAENSVFDNYGRHFPAAKPSWVKFFRTLPRFVLLHMNAFTPVIGMNLLYAFRETNPAAKRITSYHTPLSCPKGSLVYGKTGDECTVKPTTKICGACLLATSTVIPFGVAKLLSPLMPTKPVSFLPNVFYRKYLAGISINSFNYLDAQTQQWIVYSDGVRNTLLVNAVAPQKISRLVHGITPIFFSNQQKSDTEQIFVYNGRFHEIKGVETLMAAWLRLPVISNRKLWITADPLKVPEKFQDSVSQLQERPDVVFLGVKPQQELLAIYRQAHCIIVPSLSVEIGPLVFHEAIASGCNVIASDIGGCAELHQYYKTRSAVFRAKDDADLAKKIENFIYSQAHSNMPITQDAHYSDVYSLYNRILQSQELTTLIH